MPMSVSVLLEQLDCFLAGVVYPLEAAHHGLLSDPRRRFRASGVLADEVVELKRRVRIAAAGAGLYQLMIPADLDGGNAGPVTQFLVWEHLHATCGPDRILPYDSVASFTSGPGAALGGLGADLRSSWWPSVLSGERLLCFALSEPVRSPGQPALTTTAVRDGDAFLLEGEKHWVSRGGYADDALVYAVTDQSGQAGGGDGTTAFIVDLDWPGVEVRGVQKVLGRIGGEEVVLGFDSVRVPLTHTVGELGFGRRLAQRGIVPGLAYTCGRFVGLARWAIDLAGADAASRGGDDDALPELAAAQLALGDASTETAAARALALDLLRRAEEREPLGARVGAARMLAAETCARTCERCLQLLGGDGLRNEVRLFDAVNQARIVLAAEGGGLAARRALGRETCDTARSRSRSEVADGEEMASS